MDININHQLSLLLLFYQQSWNNSLLHCLLKQLLVLGVLFLFFPEMVRGNWNQYSYLTQQLSELRLIILMCKFSIPLMKKASSKAILHQVFFQLIFRF
jgi:hypothetical protein